MFRHDDPGAPGVVMGAPIPEASPLQRHWAATQAAKKHNRNQAAAAAAAAGTMQAAAEGAQGAVRNSGTAQGSMVAEAATQAANTAVSVSHATWGFQVATPTPRRQDGQDSVSPTHGLGAGAAGV